MRYLLVLLGLLVTSTAEASIDCSKQPDCTSLGFVKTDDPDCASNGYMYCPFDKSYKKCVERDCAKLGFTESDKSSWCGKITKCGADETYTLCRALCEVGDVYYSNGTCGYADEYDPQDTSKKPVGVIYYVTDNGKHGKVINLQDLRRSSSSVDFDPQKPYGGKSSLSWGSGGTDIADLANLKSCSSFVTGDHSNPFWSAGKSYTEIIAKAQGNNLQYAASAALAFYPPNVDPDDAHVGKGQWYLPTLGELMDLFGYDNYQDLGSSCIGKEGGTGTTKDAVNKTLRALSGAQELKRAVYCSSSEYDSSKSWILDMSTGQRQTNKKDYFPYVRVSLEF